MPSTKERRMTYMTNEQLAHDLAIARMAGKQLPADILVKEYRTSYQVILDFLNSESQDTAKVEPFKRPF